MTPQIITAAEVRVNDKLRFERDGYLIEGVVHDVDPELGLFFGVAWLPVLNATLTLLERATPPVPDAEGTVIQSVTDPTRLYVRWHETWVGVLDGEPVLSDPSQWKVLT